MVAENRVWLGRILFFFSVLYGFWSIVICFRFALYKSKYSANIKVWNLKNPERHLHSYLPWDNSRRGTAGFHRERWPGAAAVTVDSSKPSGRARTGRRPLGSGAKSPDDRRV